MATQIQTTAGAIVEAYDRKIPEAKSRYEACVVEYEVAMEAWFAKSAWYRFWHRYSEPFRWVYADLDFVHRLVHERWFYVRLHPATVVLLDASEAVWLGLGDSPKVDDASR